MKSRWLLVIGILTIIILVGIGINYFYQDYLNEKVNSFEECIKVKGAVVEYSYPEVCVTPSGDRFVQELTDKEGVGLVPPKDEKTNNIVKCGGWDSSGEIICQCQGALIRPVCPPNTVCDSGDYFCQGTCGSCCYKGAFDNPAYPKCQ